MSINSINSVIQLRTDFSYFRVRDSSVYGVTVLYKAYIASRFFRQVVAFPIDSNEKEDKYAAFIKGAEEAKALEDAAKAAGNREQVVDAINQADEIDDEVREMAGLPMPKAHECVQFHPAPSHAQVACMCTV